MTAPLPELMGEAVLRHTVANKLTPLLNEVQLALLDAAEYPDGVVRTLREVERLARIISGILAESSRLEKAVRDAAESATAG